MKKKEILKNNDLFNYIINNGNKTSTEYFVICKYNKNLDHPLFGVAVGKKVGNAVTRNKVKRQIRNIIDLNKDLFNNNYIYIIIGKKKCLEANFNDMNLCLNKYLLKEKNHEK